MREPPWTPQEPLQILPWGRDAAQQEALDRKKEEGRAGLKGCLFYGVAFAMLCCWLAGYFYGKP